MNKKVVFMGSPEFAVPSLEGLASRMHVVGVVTQPDRPAGRGNKLTPPPIKLAAEALGLPLIQPRRVRDPEAMDQLSMWAPDVIVVAAFGQILRQKLLELPPYGCINVHASLLPRWRGASPITAAIYHGDAETGVTIMKIDAGMDTGAMLMKQAIPISPEDTTETLSNRLSVIGAELLLATLPKYLSGEIQPEAQPEEGVTYAPMLKKEAGILDFNRTAVELERQVRAYNPWPGSRMDWQGGELKVLKVRVAAGLSANPGEQLVIEKTPAVGTGAGVLFLDQVQPAGKKPMPGKVFLNGVRNWAS